MRVYGSLYEEVQYPFIQWTTHTHTIYRHNTHTVCTDVHCLSRLVVLAKHWL